MKGKGIFLEALGAGSDAKGASAFLVRVICAGLSRNGVYYSDTVLREVDAAIAAESTAMLSDEESRRFLAALDAPFTPNERLQHAMQAAAQLQPR